MICNSPKPLFLKNNHHAYIHTYIHTHTYRHARRTHACTEMWSLATVSSPPGVSLLLGQFEPRDLESRFFLCIRFTHTHAHLSYIVLFDFRFVSVPPLPALLRLYICILLFFVSFCLLCWFYLPFFNRNFNGHGCVWGRTAHGMLPVQLKSNTGSTTRRQTVPPIWLLQQPSLPDIPSLLLLLPLFLCSTPRP